MIVKIKSKSFPLLFFLLLFFVEHSRALNVVFGPDKGINGMKVGASYIQGVTMSPKVPMNMVHKADIHMETDVHALRGNPQGFPTTAWIPGLTITYDLKKQGSTWEQVGTYMPMVAVGGPHYGINIALDGPGKYLLVNHYTSPVNDGMFLNAGKTPGIAPWWKPFSLIFSFYYVGTGKHGGY